ncbi:MAG: ATP-binding protein [Lachnospiraceae bacterium]|nr:ATP-binding protein [Lachnospiraceae bacterium]
MCFVYSYDISTQKIFKEMLDTIVNLDYDYLALLDCENKDYKMYAGNDRNQTALPSSYSNAYEDEVAKYAREYLIPEDVESNIHDMSIANLQEKLSKQDVFTSTCSMKERNGTIRRKKLQFSYLDRENGRILITRSDITDVYQKEQEYIQTLKKAMASAQQANIAKTDFLSRMSHDLRTPMNAIIGLTALAKDEITDAAAIDEYLDKINSAGNFLLGLVNDCLDIEKIASGKMELHPRPYHYDEFKNSIQTMFQPLCRQKNITFAFVEGNTGDTILADKVRFEQIFFNLLSNAVKFTPEGGKVEFIVTDEVRDQGILSADFTVRDNGCGMSEEFQRSGLFTPFEQEQNENTAQTQGTGLGLSIVKSIVDMMNGNLQIKSEQGKGTEIRVHLELPLVSDAGQGENLLQKKCNGSLTGAHVLLVEDHPLNIEIAKKLLEKCKMVVTCAGNGEEALKIFNTSVLNYYQAILMDIRMPVMNGLDATKAIRELERVDAKTVPIIAMTANAFEEDVELTKEAGMNAHLSKPIEPQRLYETLEKNIRWQKQER